MSARTRGGTHRSDSQVAVDMITRTVSDAELSDIVETAGLVLVAEVPFLADDWFIQHPQDLVSPSIIQGSLLGWM